MKLLEIKMEGWTATPRLPFILSGNAVCLPVPTYSMILGVIGCCLGRIVEANEVNIGFRYCFDDIAEDIETRQRLEYDGKRVKPHSKGTDAYTREFHIHPLLTLWINRIDWEEYFLYPVGTPALGRSQDLLKITSVEQIEVDLIEKGTIRGTMLPFSPSLAAGGQLVQLAESFKENDAVGSGRTPVKSRIFLAVPYDNASFINHTSLYKKKNDSSSEALYLHQWQ